MTEIDESTTSPRWATIGGWYLTGVGVHHLLFPKGWERSTALAFPSSTRRWVYAFGVSESTAGTLLRRPATRPLAMGWLTAQVLFIVYRFGRTRGTTATSTNTGA